MLRITKHLSTIALVIVVLGAGTGILVARFSDAQEAPEVQNARLMREYFLPIQALAPVERGAITIGPNECASVSSTGGISGDPATREVLTNANSCADKVIDPQLGYSPDIIPSGSGVEARKTSAGFQFQEGNAAVRYDFAVSESSVYQLRLGARNVADALDVLTRNQYEYLREELDAVDGYTYPDTRLLTGNSNANDELAFRHFYFQVAVDAPDNIIGVIPIRDRAEETFSSINLGLLRPGNHTLYITYANDIDDVVLGFSPDDLGGECQDNADCPGTLSCVSQNDQGQGICNLEPSFLNNFSNVDLNSNGIIEKIPLLTDIRLSLTQRTNDVIGVRVFTNQGGLSAQEWYRQNLVRQGNPVPFTVDGYNGVLDERTAYINAANVSDAGVFFTNIYVIAHNVNASPQTIEIFNRIVNNWVFNKNIVNQQGQIEGEKTKGRLRRDTTRLEQLNVLRRAIESYRASNGLYPSLEAGTFIRNHVVSTWPTWNSVFGNALGFAPPTDPLNMMATDFYPGGSGNPTVPRQYDCTDEYEETFCENICSRDDDNNALTGCQADQQCVGTEYCSVVPPGFDAVTGWNDEDQELAFTALPEFGVYDEGGNPGGFNTYGRLIDGFDDNNNLLSKYEDDAFVYQYTAIDGGQSYVLNYRLEYKNYCISRRPDGSCAEFSSTICGAGSCYLQEYGRCLQPGQSPFGELTAASLFNFNEGQGSSATDSIGVARGTLVNEPTWSLEDPAWSTEGEQSLLEFDGVNDYVQLSSLSHLNFNEGSFTVAARFRTSGTGEIISKSNGSGRQWRLHVTGAGLLRAVVDDGSSSADVLTSSVNDNTWHQAIMVVDRGNDTLRLYIDGSTTPSEAGIAAIGSLTNTESVQIGILTPGVASDAFSGGIDDVLIVNRALSSEEVAQVFSGTFNQNYRDYRNLYCFAGNIVNSCGNGILQSNAGETCEFNTQFGDGAFCDQSYSSQNWYNEGNVSEQCTTTCQLVTEVQAGQVPVPYNAQEPGLSCGGFCGDELIQYEYGEQCDQGYTGGQIPGPAFGGSGGVSSDSQYSCSPASTTTVASTANLINNSSFEQDSVEGSYGYTNYAPALQGWGHPQSQAAQETQYIDPTTDQETTFRSIERTNRLSRTGQFSMFLHNNGGSNPDRNAVTFIPVQENVSYIFTGYVRRESRLSVQGTPDAQIMLTFYDQSGDRLSFDTATNQNLNDCGTGGSGDTCNIAARLPISELPTDEWYRLSNRLTMPTGAAFVGVNLYVYSGGDPDVYGVYFDDITLVAEPGCRSFGGYCGDGLVQSQYGEQCDIANHIPPTPQRSVEQITNSGFEQISGCDVGLNRTRLGGWQIVNEFGIPRIEDGIPASTCTTTLSNQVKGGSKALRIAPSKIGGGIGHKVQYRPLQVPGGTVVNVSVDIRADDIVGSSPAPLRAQLRLFQQDPISGVVRPFTSPIGSLYLSYDLVTTATRVGLQAGDINRDYATFEGSIILPQADPATNNFNAVTLAAIVFVDAAGTLADGQNVPNAVNYFIDNVVLGSNYRLNYTCSTINNRLCQFSGGFCGDGVVQQQFNETCDLGDLNGTGQIVDGQVCSKFCQPPFCGDGQTFVMVVDNEIVQESCDPNNPNDPNQEFCGFGCRSISAGGKCELDTDCGQGASCIGGKCSEGYGGSCDPANGSVECPDGATCDELTGTCRPKLDTYLMRHFDPAGIPEGIASSLFCPSLQLQSFGNDPFIKDVCTGLEFDTQDRGRTTSSAGATVNWNGGARCDSNFVLPTVKQLYSLVTGNTSNRPYSDSTSGTVYAPNSDTKFCSLSGRVSYFDQGANGQDSCNFRLDDRYLYWTSTPYGEKVCYDVNNLPTDIGCVEDSECAPNSCDYEGYYAVDFARGTVDVLPASVALPTRCIRETECGDGIIQPGEECEFIAEGNNIGVELVPLKDRFCSSGAAQERAPYTSGEVHCDIVSCTLRYDNCAIETQVISPTPQTVTRTDIVNSCEAVCAAEGVALESFGLNLMETYPSLSAINNIDPNRRPKFHSPTTPGICPNGAPAQHNLPGVGENLCYERDAQERHLFPAGLSNRQNYSTADDGFWTVCLNESDVIVPCTDTSIAKYCGMYDGTTIVRNDNPLFAPPNCPYGYEVDSFVNWNLYDPYSPVGNIDNQNSPTEYQSPQPPLRTLCNCTVPPPPPPVIEGVSDIREVEIVNDVAVLVNIAETDKTRLNFEMAQYGTNTVSCVDKAACIAEHNPPSATLGVSDLFNLLDNDLAAEELQRRLNALAESFVVISESQNTVQDRTFSRWTFNEGVGRTSYNVGPGRSSRELGAGVDMRVDCAGVNCTRNIIWSGNGRFDGAVALDGVDDYMYTDSQFFDTQQGTISMWVNVTDFDIPEFEIPRLNGLFSYYESDNNRMRLFISESGLLTFFSSDGASCDQALIDVNVSDWQPGQWHHIALTYDYIANQHVLYVDGAEMGSSTTSCDAPIQVSGDRLAFGADQDNGWVSDANATSGTRFGGFTDGLFDEIRIYDQPLTSSQVNDLFQGSDVTALDTGLSAHFRFSESSGTTTADELSSLTGELINGPARITGYIGAGLSFNGSDYQADTGDIDGDSDVDELVGDPATADHVEIPESSNLRFTNGETVMMWVNPADVPAAGTSYGIIHQQRDWGRQMDYTSDKRFRGQFSSGLGNPLTFNSSSIFDSGQWYHLAYTYNQSNQQVRLFVNGLLEGEVTLPAPLNPSDESWFIGKLIGGSPASHNSFNGIIDEVKFYNRFLTEAQINQEFIAQQDQNTLASSLQSLYNKAITFAKANN